MKSIYDVLYSKKLSDYASIYIIDGEVIKNRDGYLHSITPTIIEKAIKNFQDVVIQNGKQIEIYSSENKLSAFRSLLYNSSLQKLVENKTIILRSIKDE